MRLIDGFQLARELLQKDLDVKSCLITLREISMDAARELHPLEYMTGHIECLVATHFTIQICITNQTFSDLVPRFIFHLNA